jgi:hypothetical protein
MPCGGQFLQFRIDYSDNAMRGLAYAAQSALSSEFRMSALPSLEIRCTLLSFCLPDLLRAFITSAYSHTDRFLNVQQGPHIAYGNRLLSKELVR